MTRMQWSILESGIIASPDPKHSEAYLVYTWDDTVLSNAEDRLWRCLCIKTGDLWIVWPQNAIDAINELCESQLEYETSHRDAGDRYAHLVGMLWDEQKTRDLIQSLNDEADLANYKPLAN